jgi:hypothetical protein
MTKREPDWASVNAISGHAANDHGIIRRTLTFVTFPLRVPTRGAGDDPYIDVPASLRANMLPGDRLISVYPIAGGGEFTMALEALVERVVEERVTSSTDPRNAP